MNKTELAKSVSDLSSMLCVSIEEAWNDHVDEKAKGNFTFEEIAEEIERSKGGSA